MPLTVATRNAMLDAITFNTVSLHNGDPGATGANEIAGGGYARQAAVFDAAANGERLLNADVQFAGSAAQAVTHFGVWQGATFRGGAALTGDAAFNAAGEYVLDAPGTKITLA